MSWCWICWRRLAGISIPVCENRQSTALPAWTGILTYASMLRSPARRAPCILPVLTNFQYVIFNTKDSEFEFIQNLNSQTSTSVTGTYTLEYDEYEGNILTGRYDHASGLWLNDYVITGLTSESMVWTVLGDPESYYVYETCPEIPADRLPDVKSM